MPRLRVGVGRGDARRDLSAHVLSRFEASEELVIHESIERAADAVDAFVNNGIEDVMNRFNGPESESSVADKENNEHSS
jgi:PTH1 family peptidyl-tRNA hydrolase